MVGLGNHDRHLAAVARRGQLGTHAERCHPFGQSGAEGGFVEAVAGAELHADEEALRQAVVERVVLGDVAALLEEVARHHVDGAQQAGTVGGEDPGVGGTAHREAPSGILRGEGKAAHAATCRPYSALASCNQSQK